MVVEVPIVRHADWSELHKQTELKEWQLVGLYGGLGTHVSRELVIRVQHVAGM